MNRLWRTFFSCAAIVLLKTYPISQSPANRLWRTAEIADDALGRFS